VSVNNKLKEKRQMNKNEIPIDPGQLMRQFRETYVNAHALKKVAPQALEGAVLATRKEKPLNEGNLPQELRSLITEYRQGNPGSKVDLLKYQQLVNGKPVIIIEDEGGLPDEDSLLNLSQTVTMTTNTNVRIITHVVVASVQKN
jgi:hypothetical protein